MATYHGVYTPKNPSKYTGNIFNIVYRSSWERAMMASLDESPNIKVWNSEDFVIPYYDPTTKKNRRYHVDFLIETIAGKRMALEVKPLAECSPPSKPKRQTKKSVDNFNRAMRTYIVNQEKWKAAKTYCEKLGIEFKVITEKELFPAKS